MNHIIYMPSSKLKKQYSDLIIFTLYSSHCQIYRPKCKLKIIPFVTT